MTGNRGKMRFAFVAVVLIGLKDPIDETLFAKDMLRGPVCGLGDCEAVTLACGVGEARCDKLLCNASSVEWFRYSQEKKVERFARIVRTIAAEGGLQLAEDIEDGVEFCAEAFHAGRRRGSGIFRKQGSSHFAMKGPRHDGEALGRGGGGEQAHEVLELGWGKANGDGRRIVCGEHLTEEAHHLFGIGLCG